MKKLLVLVTILFFLCTASLVFAEGSVVQTGDGYIELGPEMVVATFTITSDGGSVPITAFLDVNRDSNKRGTGKRTTRYTVCLESAGKRATGCSNKTS